MIQSVLGVCPVMASHVNWDKTDDGRYEPVRDYAAGKGLRIGTVHPNTFIGQQYKFGSVCSPFERGAPGHHRSLCRLRAHHP